MRELAASPWAEVKVADVIERHFCGPSPDCEERPVFDDAEWGVLKTTAITWSGWNQDAHKVLPRSYWGREGIEVKAGDVLVTKAGPRHRVAVVTHVPATRRQLVVSGKMIGLRPRSDLVLPEVLAGLLALGGPQKYIQDRTTGMAESQVNFANDVLLHTPLRLPPKAEQTGIARIARTLDTTIRQTEAIIEKLKQVKQGLLHDLLTRGIDANGELRPPQSQAPHFYKDSPLGWIPREWSFGPLSCWLEGRPKNGYSPQPAGRWTGIQMLGLGCLTVGGFEPRQLKDAPLGDPLVSKAFLVAGDLLMSRANTRELVGLVGTYRDVGTPCCYPDLMMRLTPNVKASAAFLELVLRSPQSRRQIQASASGTSGSMVKISSAIVMGLGVAMPALAEQGRILECLVASNRRLKAEAALVEQLLAVKSGLMDDLLTGRVRVTSLLA